MRRLTLFFSSLVLTASLSASVVTVSGRRLLVDGATFTVKGVDYSPVPVGSAAPYNWSTHPEIYINDFPLIAAMGANSIRTYDPITEAAALDALSGNGLRVIMGYDIPVGWDLSNASTRTFLINGFVDMVNTWKSHPAILMWVFGNEIDRKTLVGSETRNDWYSLLQAAALAAKAADPTHPVTTANSDGPALNNIGNAAVGANDASLTALDLWGVNSYRGAGFGTLFTDYAALSAKPMVMLEFGADAYWSTIGPVGENQSNQSFYITAQWNGSPTGGIKNNLSADNPALVCVGGTVFEFTDEWWKYEGPGASQLTHNTQASWTSGAYIDNAIQEEWFGITSISPGADPVRNVRTAYNSLRSMWGGTGPSAAVPEVMNVYSDAGIAGVDIQVWSDGNTGQFDGASTLLTPPEGRQSFRTSHTSWAGWGVVNGGYLNLNDYKVNGALRFWIYTSTSDVKIEVGRPAPSGPVVFAMNLNGSTVSGWTGQLNQWVPIQIDLSNPIFGGADMSSVSNPFQATVGAGGHTFYIDKVRYVRSKAITMSASVRSRTTGLSAASLTFADPPVPRTWMTADQFVRVDMDSGGNFAWGLQIYTDNKNPAVANPLYGGPAGTDPAGLVDNTDPAHVQRLPMAWHVSQSLATDVNVVHNPDNTLSSSSGRQYHWMKDAQTPDIPGLNVQAFQNGQDAVTVWDEEGMHFAPGNKVGAYWGQSWGAARSPIYLYFGAGLTAAQPGRTYKTSAIMVEFFSE